MDTLLVQEMKNARDKRLETSVADGFWNTIDHGYTTEDSIEHYVVRSIMVKIFNKG